MAALSSQTPQSGIGTQSVGATQRGCLGSAVLSISTVVSLSTALASASAGVTTIPAGTIVARIQADGGSIRFTEDGTLTPTTAYGSRLDDGVFMHIDSPLTGLQLVSTSGTVPVQVTFFDRV